MRFIYHTLTTPAPVARSFAVAALMGATILVTPLAGARAGTADTATTKMAQSAAPKTSAGAAATEQKGETVEQRIHSLHASLKITPDEETKWEAVAQAMRENASNMDKIIAESRTTSPQSMTAVDDLKMYQKFAQAHVDGLKNLTSAFSSLYSAMPDPQKKVADQVFDTAHENRQASAQSHG
jgi:hypothetical protein